MQFCRWKFGCHSHADGKLYQRFTLLTLDISGSCIFCLCKAITVIHRNWQIPCIFVTSYIEQVTSLGGGQSLLFVISLWRKVILQNPGVSTQSDAVRPEFHNSSVYFWLFLVMIGDHVFLWVIKNSQDWTILEPYTQQHFENDWDYGSKLHD